MTERLRREPLAHPPLVLDEQRGAELRERIGRRIVERPEDRLAVDDRQREHLRLAVVASLELLGNVDEAAFAEQSRELEHVLVANRDAGELHGGDHTFGLLCFLLLRLDLREKLAQVVGNVVSRQSGWKERPNEPTEPPQAPKRDDLDLAPTVCRRGVELPCASRLEEVGGDHRPSQASRLRPVVAEPLPDQPRPPRIALGYVGPRLSAVVNRHVLDIDITPQLGSMGREVTRRYEHLVGARGARLDHVNVRHAEIVRAAA